MAKHAVSLDSFNDKQIGLQDLLKMPETHLYSSAKANLTSEERRRNLLPRKYLTRPCSHIFNFKPRFTTPTASAQSGFTVTNQLPADRLKLNPGGGALNKRTQKLIGKTSKSKSDLPNNNIVETSQQDQQADLNKTLGQRRRDLLSKRTRVTV